MAGIFRRALSKTLDTGLGLVKFGIGAFITLEYVGGFVVVSTLGDFLSVLGKMLGNLVNILKN